MRQILLIIFSILPVGLIFAQKTYFDTSIPNKYVEENRFRTMEADLGTPPEFAEIQSLLPQPYWPSNPDVIASYWRIWELEFSHLLQVTGENKFISPYIEPAFFNRNIFMWDACFMTMFGNYGSKAFNFIQSLDNFYCKQHQDGYICREISILEGFDCFSKYDPSSTGPNLMPWAEWEYYTITNDVARLEKVFPVLVAYNQWYRMNRTWPDHSYFSTGWGSGMDNQPRLPKGEQYDPRFSHGFMSWIDINLQQIFVGKILVQMANVLGRQKDVEDVTAEVEMLTNYVRQKMWDEKTAFFYDRNRDGSLNYVKSIAAYWSLVAGVVPPENADSFIAHLENPKEFARPHRVPTLSADHPDYSNNGYWCGPVWAPTNYMVLKGLTEYRKDSLAHEIALNHVTNVAKVYTETGTFWENYTPETIGGTAMKDFADWNGVVPVNILFEYVFGIRPDIANNTLLIDVRLKDEYGVKQYPYGKEGKLDISCGKRKKETDKPSLTVQANVPVKLIVKWQGGEISKNIYPGKTKL